MYPIAVGHLDADCFYVSAERVRDPFLIGKPVGVLGNNGACVIAKSYEMKALGVRTGEPIWDAVKVCPHGIYVKRDFRWYEVLSRLMLDILRDVSPKVEYYSIDEFFFIAEPRRGQSHAEYATMIRDRIFAETRLPVTVAIARTRTLAKLMTDTFKPFGAKAILDRAAEIDLLRTLPVQSLSGIARRRAARLEPYNVRTCLDLAEMRRSLVRSLLTITGEQMWRELNGESVLPIQSERPPHKMLSRGGSIGSGSTDPHLVYAWLVRNLERLIEELEFHQVRAGHLTVILRYAEGPDGYGDGPLDTPTDRFDLLLDAARIALREAWRDGRKVTHMHILATRLCSEPIRQRTLFDTPNDRREAVARVKRAINQCVGRFAVRSGATLALRGIYEDPSNGYDICDIHGKHCF